MPASFRILPERGLVYVQYSGFIRLADTQRLIQAYLAHPDRHPGQKQLVDLAAVTGFEQDFVGVHGEACVRCGERERDDVGE